MFNRPRSNARLHNCLLLGTKFENSLTPSRTYVKNIFKSFHHIISSRFQRRTALEKMFSNFIIMSSHLPLTADIMIRDSINQKCHPRKNDFSKYPTLLFAAPVVLFSSRFFVDLNRRELCVILHAFLFQQAREEAPQLRPVDPAAAPGPQPGLLDQFQRWYPLGCALRLDAQPVEGLSC
ncbi:hypothetical protein Zmor_000147 [Zophobas morio]|uniref:Uncharacterized protein n=1 Tax=Zophobas morio TaxID=2755281 RepID=A0AA38J0A3_9CUCU|nr:hypothetical protein Zmor_000147 [Zophobas morio]